MKTLKGPEGLRRQITFEEAAQLADVEGGAAPACGSSEPLGLISGLFVSEIALLEPDVEHLVHELAVEQAKECACHAAPELWTRQPCPR